MSLKSLILNVNGSTPNPVKVAILLEELGLPYEAKITPYDTIKSEPYVSLNPNGRLPALKDPNNNDLALFESGAIVEYLVATYDKNNRLHAASGPNVWLEKSWLHFQVSGQGPYFGQLAWFVNFHPEKNLTSVLDRYTNEVKRVTGVIEAHLKKQGTSYLLSNELSYVDLAWVPWFVTATGPFLKLDWDYQKEYPLFAAWFHSLKERPSVKAVYANPSFQKH